MAVYCLVDSARDAVKVGYSRDNDSLKKRIKTLQTASPFEIELLAVREDWGRPEEAKVHQELKEFQLDGGREWFDYNKSIDVIRRHFPVKNPRGYLDFSYLNDRYSDEELRCPFTGLTSEDVDEWFYDSPASNNLKVLPGYGRNVPESESAKPSFAPYVKEKIGGTWRRIDFLTMYEHLTPSTHLGTIFCASTIADHFFSPILGESGELCYPQILSEGSESTLGGSILYLINAPFGFAMPVLEKMAQLHFWILDGHGLRAKFAAIDESRDVKLVPLEYCRRCR